jgi:hypothetical protein
MRSNIVKSVLQSHCSVSSLCLILAIVIIIVSIDFVFFLFLFYAWSQMESLVRCWS